MRMGKLLGKFLSLKNTLSHQISGSIGDLTLQCRGILKGVKVDESGLGEKESKLAMPLCQFFP